MLRRPVRFAALALLLVLFFAGPSAVGFYTDWLWFGEVGYQSVFLTMLRAQATLFVAAFTAGAPPVGDVARLAQRRAVRHGGPDSRPRRRILCLLAPVPADGARAGAGARAHGRARGGPAVLRLRERLVAVRVDRLDDAPGSPPPPPAGCGRPSSAPPRRP